MLLGSKNAFLLCPDPSDGYPSACSKSQSPYSDPQSSKLCASSLLSNLTSS